MTILKNILFITSDQQRADSIGYENPEIKTPNLDGLAKRGTRFSNCITPSVVCQPARAAILTGRLPLTNGVWDNGVDLDPEMGAKGMAALLANKGYSTTFIGKAHFSTKNTFSPTGTPECKQSAPEYADDWYGPYMGFEYVELAALGKFHPKRLQKNAAAIHRFENSFLRFSDSIELWLDKLTAGNSAAQTWNSRLPIERHSSTWVANQTIESLKRVTKENRPFFIWASFPDPHHPFDCPAPWNSLYQPEKITLPKHRVLDLEKRPWWHKAALEGTPQIADPEMAKFRQEGFKVPPQTDIQLAEMMANYYGMISLIDHQVGKIIAELKATEQLENTLIVYASDHGDMLGDHGLYLKGPMIYEGVLRVPLLMVGPDIPENKLVDMPVSTIDLAATFLETAGIQENQNEQSQSLYSVINGKSHRECVWSEWYVHPSRLGVSLQLRTVRTQRYSYTYEMSSCAGELYDLKLDPDQLINCFNDPLYKIAQDEMHRLLMSRPGPILEKLNEPVGMA
jgi:arylsulfatase A-like enzyme